MNTAVFSHNFTFPLRFVGPVSDGKCVYIGEINDNWGFFLTESLSRIWYVIEHPGDYKITYSKPDNVQGRFGIHTGRILEMFSLLGISEDRLVEVNEQGNAFVPEMSFFHLEVPTFGKKTPMAYLNRLDDWIDGHPAFFYTTQYKEIYSTIRDNCVCNLPKYEKVYLSRRRLKRKKEVGEKSLEELFSANGFQIIYPELLSPREQVWYVKNARVLASVEGTLAHNSLFASEGLVQIVLRKQSEIIPRQYMINQAIGVESIVVDSFSEPFHSFPISHSKGPFLLTLNNEVRKMCGDRGYVFVKPSVFTVIANYAEYSIKCVLYLIEKKMKSIIR